MVMVKLIFNTLRHSFLKSVLTGVVGKKRVGW